MGYSAVTMLTCFLLEAFSLGKFLTLRVVVLSLAITEHGLLTQSSAAYGTTSGLVVVVL